MAALRPCPSGLAVGTRALSISCPSPTRTSTIPALGKHCSTSLLNLKTLVRRTTAPSVRRRHVIRAQNGTGDWPIFPDPNDDKPVTEEEFNQFREELKKRCELDKDMLFREDIEKIDEYWNKMTSWNTSIFHMQDTALSLYLCVIVKKGVRLASRIMDSAVLALDKQDEFSLHTTKQTLAVYVSMFVKLAEDTYHKKFNLKSVCSLFDAFRGVGAIGHILLQDAISSVNYDKHGSSNYSLASDSDNAWHEFEEKMNNLEQKFMAVSNNNKLYELVRPTMVDAMTLTIFFVSKMVGRHEMVIGKVPGSGTRPWRDTKATDDAEPGSSEAGSGST